VRLDWCDSLCLAPHWPCPYTAVASCKGKAIWCVGTRQLIGVAIDWGSITKARERWAIWGFPGCPLRPEKGRSSGCVSTDVFRCAERIFRCNYRPAGQHARRGWISVRWVHQIVYSAHSWLKPEMSNAIWYGKIQTSFTLRQSSSDAKRENT
jgi:hypothetical protein